MISVGDYVLSLGKYGRLRPNHMYLVGYLSPDLSECGKPKQIKVFVTHDYSGIEYGKPQLSGYVHPHMYALPSTPSVEDIIG
jgi:hypothetical protein